jgi:hypothetical protein
MPDYQQGKIYKLTGAGKIYIGSTTQLLSKRYWAHKNAGISTVQEIIADPNNQITLIELFPCSCKVELLARERYYIEQNDCINKYCPIRTVEEKQNSHLYDETRKKWQIANKEKMFDYWNNYQKKIEVKQKKQLMRQTQEYKEYMKNYRNNKKDEIKQYKQTPEQRIAQKAYRERKKAEKLALQQN